MTGDWTLILGINLDCAAALTLERRMSFARGYDHFQVLRDIVDPEVKTNHTKFVGFKLRDDLTWMYNAAMGFEC